MSRAALQAVLVIAALSCCVAMSMPQVHIKALAKTRLGTARRAAPRAVVDAGAGVVSRLSQGWICDPSAARPTLLLGSGLRPWRSFSSCPTASSRSTSVSAFGLVRGGITPAYAVSSVNSWPTKPACVSARARGLGVRHGARRMDVGRDLRRHRLVSSRSERTPWNAQLRHLMALPTPGRLIAHAYGDPRPEGA